MELTGTTLMGSTTISTLFRNSMGPEQIAPAMIAGNAAATYPMGAALVDSATAGYKVRYTNALNINNEAVGTGDGTAVTFNLAHTNVIAATLKPFLAVGGEMLKAGISVGTGPAGVDQIVFDIAPANTAAFLADYSYYAANTKGVTGACVLLRPVVTTVGGPNVLSDACYEGSVDQTMVVDSAGALVDTYFRSQLHEMFNK